MGLIGLSADMSDSAAFFDLSSLPILPLVRNLAGALRDEGADAIVILSHLGLRADRDLAAGLSGEALAILGGHSHDLLPDGERIGDVWIAQAGQYAGHLGRVDLAWDGGGLRVFGVGVIPVDESLPMSQAILAEAVTIEAEGQRFLAEVIGELVRPLDFAADRECGVADL